MKKLIIACIVLLPLLTHAQITEYKATNGLTYHLNDTVRLGRGTAPNGEFLYIEERGIPSPGRTRFLPKEFTNGGVIIKKINTHKRSGLLKYDFVVSAGGLFNFSLYIDDAISACEVVPCGKEAAKPAASVADELKKLKALLDSGALTQAEYDAQKKKLLNQ